MNLARRVADRLAAAHPNHQRIAAGAALIASLALVAKICAAAREMAIAWRYGVSATVDAYQLSLTITMWLPMMLSSVMTVILVPRLVGLRAHTSERQEFVGELNGAILLLGIVIAAVTWVAAPAISSLLGAKTNAATTQLTAAMSRQMAPVALFTLLGGYLSARLQSRERFAYSATEAIPSILIALLVLVPLALDGPGPLIVGTLMGYFLQAAVLGIMTRAGDPPLGDVRVRRQSPEWSTLYRALFVMAAGQIVIALTVPIDQVFAARLGSGEVATLGYANRIIVLITGFGAVVLARALLPVLAGAVAAGEREVGRRQSRQWAGLLFGAGALIGATVWILASWAIAVVFERGAFTSEDTSAVAHVLRYGLLQLPFYFAGLALVQWIAALRRYASLFIIASVALILKLIMNLLLVPLFGLGGIMMATAGMYAFSFAGQYWVVSRAE